MNKGLWIWTTICIILTALIIWAITLNHTYIGNDITLNADTSHSFNINADTVSIEAASVSFFAIHSSNGESIISKSSPKPLGWNGDYFKTEPMQIHGGLWEIDKGNNITIHITSSSRITILEYLMPSIKILTYFLIILMMSLIWLLCVIAFRR
jgi:hypothetical protein